MFLVTKKIKNKIHTRLQSNHLYTIMTMMVMVLIKRFIDMYMNARERERYKGHTKNIDSRYIYQQIKTLVGWLVDW